MSKQTERTVEIYDILLRETDQAHPINSKEIMQKRNIVANENQTLNRKKVYSSIADIKEVNEHVRSARRKNQGWYMEHEYTEADVFFAGSVLSKVRCISSKEKKNICKRLKDIIYPNARKYLDMDYAACFAGETMTGTLEFILNIQDAITNRKKIMFYYMAFDAYLQPVRKHDGKHYKVSPYYMFFSGETMYLFAAEDDSSIIKTYRVDRMDVVEQCDEEVIPPRKYIKGDVQKELRRRAAETVNNFDGMHITVFLDVVYSTTAMNIIFDQVGTNAEVFRYDKSTGHELIKINVRRSPTLTGWLMQNIEFFSVISPQCIIDDIVAVLDRNNEVYISS